MNAKTRLFTIRNKSGQYLGAYRAPNAKTAIAAFMRGQAFNASQFKGWTVIPASDVVAAVEGE